MRVAVAAASATVAVIATTAVAIIETTATQTMFRILRSLFRQEPICHVRCRVRFAVAAVWWRPRIAATAAMVAPAVVASISLIRSTHAAHLSIRLEFVSHQQNLLLERSRQGSDVHGVVKKCVPLLSEMVSAYF